MTRRWLTILALLLLPGAAPHGRAADPATDSPEARARRNLQVLGHALARYMLYNDGKMPKRISELHEQNFVFDLQAFASPASTTKIASAGEIDAKTDYFLTTHPSQDRPLLLIKEKRGLHGGKALAFYSDRSVRPESPGYPGALLGRSEAMVFDGESNQDVAATSKTPIAVAAEPMAWPYAMLIGVGLVALIIGLAYAAHRRRDAVQMVLQRCKVAIAPAWNAFLRRVKPR